MIRTRRGRHIITLTMWCKLCIFSLGCTIFKGAPAPSFATQRNLVAEQSQRLQHISAVMNADLREFQQLHDAFFAHALDIYASPFPIDLFKQTAMSCLNKPSSTVGESPEQLAYTRAQLISFRRRFGISLTCVPNELETCINTIVRRTPERLEFALAQLQNVDKLRRLRAKLKRRNTRLKAIIEQQYTRLATWRAEWRKTQAQLDRRRDEFNKNTWSITQTRLNRYKDNIEALKKSIVLLESTSVSWPNTLETLVDRFYRDLAGLYYRDTGSLFRDTSRNFTL